MRQTNMWYEQPTERQFRGSIVQRLSEGIRYGIATITRIQTDKGCDFIRRKDKATGAWSGAAIGSVTVLFGWAANAYDHVDHQ